MARLPQVGGDKGDWGNVLNEYLQQSHDDTGALRSDTVGTLQLQSNAVNSSKLADQSVTPSKISGLGTAGGIASLDGQARVPSSQLPAFLSLDSLSETYANVDINGIPITKKGVRVSTAAPVDLRDHFNVVAPPTDFSGAFSSAINEANATSADGWIRSVFVPDGYWDIASTIDVVDKSVILSGPGVVRIAAGAGFLNITQTLSAGLSGSVSTLRAEVSGSKNTEFSYAKESLFTPTSQADIRGFKNGDIFYLDSNTSYTPNWVSVSDQSTFKGQWFPVYGIGLTVAMTSGNGGVPVGSTIIGQTSNAKAVVAGTRRILNGASLDRSLSLTSVVDATTGQPSAFVNGETLQAQYGATNQPNAAVISANPYLISATRLLDAHESGAQMHKVVAPNMIVDIDVVITVLGNSDAPVGTSQRKPAIQLTGVASPSRIHAVIRNGWTRAIQFRGCWMPTAVVTGEKLPNNAALTDQGYGYMVEAYGSTEGGRFSINGRNCRHAFTTNTTSSASRLTTLFSRTGVPKWNTVHDSTIIGNVSASFDTHGGCYATTFENCRAIGVSGGRDTTGPYAFQQRGAATRYLNCVAEGVTSGWTISVNRFDYDWDNEVRLDNCSVIDYTAVAFDIGAGGVASSNQKIMTITLNNCTAIGSGESSTTSGNIGVGYQINSGQRVKLYNCQSTRDTGYPILLTSAAPSNAIGAVSILNHIVDYADAITTSAPITVSRAPTHPVVIDNLTALTNDVSNSGGPGSWLQVAGVSGVGLAQFRIGRLVAPYRTNNVNLISYSDGSAPANADLISIREQGVRIYGSSTITIESLAAAESTIKTVSCSGATPGDLPVVSFSGALPNGIVIAGSRVSSNDTVQVTFTNVAPNASVASGSGSLVVQVQRRGSVA